MNINISVETIQNGYVLSLGYDHEKLFIDNVDEMAFKIKEYIEHMEKVKNTPIEERVF